MVDSSFCATIVRGSTIIAIMGFYELWPGTIEVWVLPSIHIPEYAKSYLRHVKRYINNIKKTFKPHRMQTMAINDELHDKWMGFLGFKKEGIIEKYSADKVDYAMWALIP